MRKIGQSHDGAKRGAAFEVPFSFNRWIRLHGVDIVTMALMGASGLGIYEARKQVKPSLMLANLFESTTPLAPAPSRFFPIYFRDGQVVYPQFAYPLRKEIVPIWAAALVAFLAPFFFICVFQTRRKSADDFLTTTMGLLKSLVTAAVFQVWVKWLIGGLRPHFYAVCQPDVPGDAAPSGNGFASLMYDRSVCTGDKKLIDDALEAMPSGHSTAAWAGLFYLALYFNAQLKVMSAHNPAYWKMILFFCPILGATLISGALTIDKYHNSYDVVAGAIIGICTAAVAFRQTFASILDFRFNHLLLSRTTSLFHRAPFLPSASHTPYFTYEPTTKWTSADLPFTREGGWGWGEGEAFVGASEDATAQRLGGGGIEAAGYEGGVKSRPTNGSGAAPAEEVDDGATPSPSIGFGMGE
ncbi:hypothetical protein DXG03_005186 [Asterophora parasitica]|uniref:Phosphatidic acid phosphatase type 2/haloperoxidase domain-containing protein n=1 Tax=Asterophora parasitica TaxID=117018 RepID=A0A9P7GA92_9AGAR|nr:hypothetical protein DXG03_005186 [Asterophora parasitica]